jgi:hypothetical protein
MRKRTHVKGVLSPLAAKWVGVLFVAYLTASITEYVTQSRGIPNPLVTRPFAHFSLGWYLSQAAAILVGVGAGALSCFFAPVRTWTAPAILIGGYLVLGIASVPASSGWLLGSYFVLVGASSLLVGAITYKYLENRREPRRGLDNDAFTITTNHTSDS